MSKGFIAGPAFVLGQKSIWCEPHGWTLNVEHCPKCPPPERVITVKVVAVDREAGSIVCEVCDD